MLFKINSEKMTVIKELKLEQEYKFGNICAVWNNKYYEFFVSDELLLIVDLKMMAFPRKEKIGIKKIIGQDVLLAKLSWIQY